MAASQPLGYCMWLDGSTISAQIARVQDVSSSFASGGTVTAMATQPGVIPSVGSLQVVQNSGMNVLVQAGFAIIPNSTAATQGAYKAGSMVSNTITVATSDPTNPRIDLIVLTVTDLGTSSSSAYLQTVTGTPAVSPVAPSAPANSLILAQIAVGAGVSSITSGNITDKRTFTAAAGGVVPYSATASAVGGYPGCIGYAADKDRFFHNNSPSTNEQIRTLPWAPVYNVVSSNFTLTTSAHTYDIVTVNFTVDGNTDVKTTIKWPGCFMSSGSVGSGTGLWQLGASITIDTTQLDAQYSTISPPLQGTTIGAGSMLVYTTNSATGDTPTAGTHTMKFQMISNNIGGSSTGGPVVMRATAAQLIYIRVEPVNL